MPEKLKSINEFKIYKVNNGFTVSVRYVRSGETWPEYGEFIAKDLTDVHAMVDMWFKLVV